MKATPVERGPVERGRFRQIQLRCPGGSPLVKQWRGRRSSNVAPAPTGYGPRPHQFSYSVLLSRAASQTGIQAVRNTSGSSGQLSDRLPGAPSPGRVTTHCILVISLWNTCPSRPECQPSSGIEHARETASSSIRDGAHRPGWIFQNVDLPVGRHHPSEERATPRSTPGWLRTSRMLAHLAALWTGMGHSSRQRRACVQRARAYPKWLPSKGRAASDSGGSRSTPGSLATFPDLST